MVSSTKNNNECGSNDQEGLVYEHKLTSVGPGVVSGNNSVYEPSNMDLAMKLHYLKVVYFMESEAVEGITLRRVKECLFSWCDYYYESCGRFRRCETNGKPYIKCNDCGYRLIEAKSAITMEDWLRMEDTSAHHMLLVPHNHVLGPELTFSPLVFLQITFFKCGGISLGISWAHVLGDAFSLSNYMNTLAQHLSGLEPNLYSKSKKSLPNFYKPMKEASPGPQSIMDVGPLGDHWIRPTPCEMGLFSFHVTHTQLAQLQSRLSRKENDIVPTGNDQCPSPIQPFDGLCAIIWQAVAKTRAGPKPNVVTVVKKDGTGPNEDKLALGNNQVVGSVKADFSVATAQPKDLATLIRDWAHDERAQIEEMVDRDPRASDFVVYGSNLTFVDLEEVGFYGFEVNGLSPRYVHCSMDGIGEEGVVLVLPTPQNGYGNVKNVKSEGEGRIVTLILPKSYMEELKEELKNAWDLVA